MSSQDDDGSICSICLDNFHSSGLHRLISLRCGHLFGDSCIRTWVKEQKNCPQCKAKTNVRDFRSVFATKIQIVDNSRELELEMKIQKLENEKRDLSASNMQNAMTIAIQKRLIRELQNDIDRLKHMTLTRKTSGTDCIQLIKSGRMYLEKNIDFKDNAECKIIKYMLKSKKLTVSQKLSGATLFSGYGLRFIDIETYRFEKFLNISTKPLIDFTLDQSETLIASTSRESVCKIYNVSNSQGVASLSSETPVPIWCCSFNKNRDNQMILGAQNGSILVFDIKRPTEVFQTLSSLENKTPVKFILSMSKNEAFPFGGFFVIHVRGLYFYEMQSNLEFIIAKLNFDDSILAASYDDKTDMLLLSTPTTDQTVHIIMRLLRADDVPVLQEVYRIPINQMSTSRPAQIKVADGFIVTCYSNEHREMQVYTPSVGKFHSISTQSIVTDFCPIYAENKAVTFAALCPTKCRIYNVNLEYR